ncbi:MAG TPA: energy transducer TonB [Stellaceae bacterium]|jgi:protein TonB
MQAKAIKDVATGAALGDRAWQHSLGASGLLHGTVIAALLLTWHIDSKPLPELRRIPVTLVHTDETASERAAQPTEAAPEPPTPRHEAEASEPSTPQEAAVPPAPTVTATTEAPPPPVPPVPPAKPGREAAPTKAQRMLPPPRVSSATPKPDATITALLSESLDGQPRDVGTSHGAAIALRSSAKLSDDYLLGLQAWIARQERYPAEARAQNREGKGIVGFTIARDGKVTRVWIDQTTGSSVLDQASLATIRDASPVPPLPHDITGDSVDFFLPVNYALSNFERLFR